MSEILLVESGLQLKESGISLVNGIRNSESGIQYLESGIHGVKSRIQDCLGFSNMVLKVSVELRSRILFSLQCTRV